MELSDDQQGQEGSRMSTDVSKLPPAEFEPLVDEMGAPVLGDGSSTIASTIASTIDAAQIAEMGTLNLCKRAEEILRETRRRNTERAKMGNGDTLDKYLALIDEYPLLTSEQELVLARAYKATGDKRFSERLVECNLRFVVKIALYYNHFGFPLLDLIQEGNAGLVKGVGGFDPSRGFKVISYAVWWIKASIQEYILENWSMVKLGTTQLQRRIFNCLVGKVNPEVKESAIERIIAKETEVRKRQVESVAVEAQDTVRRVLVRDFSLDAPVRGDDEGYTNASKIPDRTEPAVSDVVIDADCKGRCIAAVREAINRVDLTDRERYIFEQRRLPEKSRKPPTLRELGEKLRISKERVRQLEVKALGRIAEYLKAHYTEEDIL